MARGMGGTFRCHRFWESCCSLMERWRSQGVLVEGDVKLSRLNL